MHLIYSVSIFVDLVNLTLCFQMNTISLGYCTYYSFENNFCGYIFYTVNLKAEKPPIVPLSEVTLRKKMGIPSMIVFT